MIKNWRITGDTHGANSLRISYLLENEPELIPEETALIILGDAGFNYYLNKKDRRNKAETEAKGVYIYCVRGNHEARPGEKLGMKLVSDENVGGPVWIEEEFPHIRYFTDWGFYNIDGLRALVIGGAYSVDKYYRIANNLQWFENEQLAYYDREACLRNTEGKHFDLVLSHTCPLSLQPTDLFLNFIDQFTVDNSMEVWMEELAHNMNWKLWLFAHYHTDRIEWSHVEQFYMETESLNDIVARWTKYDETGELDWWLPLSPKMKRLMESE